MNYSALKTQNSEGDSRGDNDNNVYSHVGSIMIPCPDCERLVPDENMELHQLRACPSKRASASTLEAGGEDESSPFEAILASAVVDSPSLRPRKSRRRNASEEGFCADEMIHDRNSQRNITETIDLVGCSSDIDYRDTNLGASFNTNDAMEMGVDMNDADDEAEDSGEDRKLPAKEQATPCNLSDIDSEDGSDHDHDNDGNRKLPARENGEVSIQDENGNDSIEKWNCPRCTLINNLTSSVCEVCRYRNVDLEIRHGSEAQHISTPERSSRRRPQQPASASSHLGFIGGGALLGAAVGMAGNWMKGRDPVSGAIEGGTTGAVSGALLHEVLVNTSNDPNEPHAQRHIAPTTGGTVEAVSPTRTNHEDVIDLTSTPSQPQHYHIDEQASVTTGVTMHRSMDVTEGSPIQPRGHRSDTTRQETSSFRNTTTSQTDRHNAAMSNLMLRHSLQMSIVQNEIHRQSIHQLSLVQLLQQTQTRTMSGNQTRTNSHDIDEMNYEQLLNRFGDGTENMGAHQHEIGRLPTHVVSEDPLPEDARQCLICLEDFQTGETRTILPCLHGFHQHCAQKWLTTKGMCPVCKHRISSNG